MVCERPKRNQNLRAQQKHIVTLSIFNRVEEMPTDNRNEVTVRKKCFLEDYVVQVIQNL